MVDYVKIFTEAVNSSSETKMSVIARAQVYQRCLQALDRYLAKVNPPLSNDDLEAERLKLLAASEVVEKLMSHPAGAAVYVETPETQNDPPVHPRRAVLRRQAGERSR